MLRQSLLSRTFTASLNRPPRHRRRRAMQSGNSASDRPAVAPAIESMEQRVLLSAVNDLALLSDEFNDAGTTANWQRLNEVEHWNADQLQVYDINQTQPGRLVMAPHSAVWYQDWRGPMAFKSVTGDFVVTTQVHISDRDDLGVPDADGVPNEAQFSLGGVMIRTSREISDPTVDWQPGSRLDDGTNDGENYVFMSLGHATDGQFSFEVKTTRNSNSQLEITPANTETATLQIARIGSSVIALRQIPGEGWVVHRRFSRPDLPETIQVGIVSYTDWEKANDFDPFYHNGHVLTADGPDPTPAEPFNPDLVAGYEYARYFRPQLPAELSGIDLVNGATDEQLLGFLGDNANLPVDPDPIDDVPMVSISAITPMIAETSGSSPAFVVSRVSDDITDALTVHYSVGGTAQAGIDYAAPAGTAIIPAGASSVVIAIDPHDDADVEGSESIAVELVDQVFYEIGDPDASIEITDNDFESIGNQSMTTQQDTLTIALPTTHPDGQPLVYSASVVGGIRYELDQQFNFTTAGDFYENWGGMQERWIRGDGSGWFYLLPDGTLYRWEGSFASSTEIAEPGSEVYHDPMLLIDVTAPAAVSMIGNELRIDPIDGFAGSFDVDVTKSNGNAQETERISVAVELVANDPPSVAPIADQTVSHAENELRIPFVVSDVNGDTLFVTVSVVSMEVYELDQQFDFNSTGDYHDNWGGHDERWVTANAEGSQWFYLLPDGQLHQWNGSFETSPLIASLDAAIYDDPTQLTDAEPIDVDLAVEGNEIVIRPGGTFVGQFDVMLQASDGTDSASTQFTVDVTNVAPTLSAIGDLVISAVNNPLSIPLLASDADGDALTWSVEVVNGIAWNLDAELQLETATDFHTNWGGHNEKWLRSAAGNWYFILENGEFYRWNGDFASSELLAALEESFYANPNGIADPQPLSVVATVSGNMLTIDIAAGFTSTFQILLTVSDGLTSTSQLVNITADM